MRRPSAVDLSVTDLPALNAALNGAATVLLTAGLLFIRAGRWRPHRLCMLGAVGLSALFLASYSVYHVRVGSVPYPLHDWTRPLYFSILLPHILLAAAMIPLVPAALLHAFRRRFDRHRRLARWLWPIWMFVSLSGVVIYWMLYHLAGARAPGIGS